MAEFTMGDPKHGKDGWRTLFAFAVLITALVGGTFGYYGASLNTGGSRVPVATDEREESATVVSLVEKASPAVVSIVASKDVQVMDRFQGSLGDFCDDPFFRQFFDCEQNQRGQRQTQRQEVAAGTGFIIRPDGLIITNKHVISVAGADLTVITSDGKQYAARILAQDPVQDIALVKVDGKDLPTLALGDSDKLAVGQTVVAIGNALGELTNSVSKGIISGLSRSITASSGVSSERLEEVIQTDAAINPGNSGGPLLDLDGKVIGINTAIVSGAQNLGFAIPINQVKRDIQQVEQFGKISYPYLGVRYVMVTDAIKEQKNLDVDYGALIIQGTDDTYAVAPDSPAARAGLRADDVILEVNGRRLDLENSLASVIAEYKVGDTIRLRIRRGGSTVTVPVTLGERNE